jgi:hypothetical protein
MSSAAALPKSKIAQNLSQRFRDSKAGDDGNA